MAIYEKGLHIKDVVFILFFIVVIVLDREFFINFTVVKNSKDVFPRTVDSFAQKEVGEEEFV